MPINRKYPLADVLKAGRDYGQSTGRRVTYEYILIDGVNDNLKQARELASLLRGQLASVNLIPINPVAERDWRRPSLARIEFFANYLTSIILRLQLDGKWAMIYRLPVDSFATSIWINDSYYHIIRKWRGIFFVQYKGYNR